MRWTFFLIVFLILSATVEAAKSDVLKLINNGRLDEAATVLEQADKEETEALFLRCYLKWKTMWISTFNQQDAEDLLQMLDRLEEVTDDLKDDDDDALFFYASNFGIRAQLAGSRGKWWEAAQAGKKMKQYSEALLERSPNYFDSQYLLGSFNYLADVLPNSLKLLRTLLFLPDGDKSEGLKQLIAAYKKGRRTDGEAGLTLTYFYTYYERRFDYGLTMSDNYLSRYPDNPMMRLYKAVNLHFGGASEQSLDLLEVLRVDLLGRMNKAEESDLWMPLERETSYWMARNMICLDRKEEAMKVLSDLLEPPIDQPYWLLRWVRLSIAQMYYRSGNISKANDLIAEVLDTDDVKNSHKKARLLLKKKEDLGCLELDPF